MKIVHAAQMAWGENLAAHRASGIQHKVLFEGEEGTPDNFLLVMAKESSAYSSPRHRHPWDQVRYCIEGSVPVGRDLSVDAGEVAYFPEGAPYGPQEGGGDRVELLLQFGGASGLGYLSARQVKEAHAELARDGVFANGAYKRSGKNTDAYEAIWRHVTQKPLVQPPPCYKAPIVMRSANFSWGPEVDGVKQKLLGFFPERGLMLEFVSLVRGATWKAASFFGGRHFVFVCTGEGWFGEACTTHSVCNLDPGESEHFAATADTRLFVIGVQPVTRSSESP